MKSQLLRVGGAVAAVALVVTTALLYFQNRPERAEDTALTFTVSPHEVQVIIDEEDYGTVATGDTLTVPLRREADIEVSRAGFVPYTATLTIEPGTPYSVDVELHPETNEAEALLTEELELAGEQTATERQLEAAEEAYENYPILHDLPQHGENYSVYQGLADSSGFDFGLHLYLYAGYEDQGREAFNDWMQREGYDVDDYDVIEHIEDEAPPLALPEPPTWNELQERTHEDVEIPSEVTADGLDHGELALRFAEISATWDTAEDVHHTEGLIRAAPLMTEELADTIELPHRPTTTPIWRDAASYEARSVPWVAYHEEEKTDAGVEVSMDVCWAWVTDGDVVFIDGPRKLELSIIDTSGAPRVDDFLYDDPDPFVDNSNSPCHPDDAPQ